MKKRSVYFVIVGIIVICSLVCFFMNYDSGYSETAFVYVDGELYLTIDLSDKLYREYTVKTKSGINTIAVSENGICVLYADCPDKICVQRGYVKYGGLPIICLPHKLEIILSEETYDGAV